MDADTIGDVLSDVKMFTTKGITAPAMSPYTIGAGSRRDPAGEPESVATRTISSARIVAPASSGKVT